MATAKQKQAAKDRAAANASNKSGNQGNPSAIGSTSLEKMKGFDPSYFGTAFQQAYNQADPSTKSTLNILGSVMIKQAQDNTPIPTALTASDIKDLWAKAESDPTIQQYYADDLKVGTANLQTNLATLTSDFQNTTGQQQRDFVEAKKNLLETQAAQGTAYSGFRKQAEQKQSADQSGIITSTRSQLQQQLNSQQQAFEQKFGSSALSSLGLGGVSAATTPGYTGPDYGTPATYTPIGGVAGTEATAKVEDVQNQYKELASQTLQQRGVNYSNN